MKSSVVSAFLAVFFWILSPAVSAPVDPYVHFQGGSLSVTFVTVPIRTALEEVATRTGISVLLDPDIKGTISSRFKDLPLEVALQRLLRNQSYAFVFLENPKEGQSLGSVKVFREGQLSSANYEVLGGGVVGSVRTAPGEMTGKFGETGKGPLAESALPVEGGENEAVADGGKSGVGTPSVAAINPHSLAAPAQVMRAIATVQRDMDHLQRKSVGEERALRRGIAKIQRKLASAGSDPKVDPREALEEMRVYEDQLARSKQGNALRMIEKQKEMQKLTEKLADLSNPAEQTRRYASRQKQQAGARRSRAAIKAMAERRAKRL